MTKLAAFAVAAVVIAVFMTRALLGLPSFGHHRPSYGSAITPISLDERATTNVTAAVAYDIRGFDTLGEELVLAASALGVTLILRSRGEAHRIEEGVDRARRVMRDRDASRPAVRRASADVVAISLAFGWYMTLHATQTPGGGFQGGAIIASALSLFYLGFGYRSWSKLLAERAVDAAEGSGVLAFLAIAAAPLAWGAAILTNLLPKGALGAFGSGGTMFWTNIAIAIAVAAGFTSVVGAFLFDLHEDIEAVGPRPEPERA